MESKKKYKIVASDLDGTLLGTDQRVSCENLEAIEKMHSLGVEFVPATGRALGEIPYEIMNSSDIRYIITSDGAAVWDKTAEKYMVKNYMPADVVRFVVDTVNKYTSCILVHENGITYYDAEKQKSNIFDTCHIDSYFRSIIEARAYPKASHYDFMMKSDAVEMFCIFFESLDALNECRRLFVESGKLSVAQSAPYNLEICFSGAGKANALRELADIIGIDISDTIAVGDSTNDSAIVKAAGLGLAMENACADLKAIADKVICNNSEHSAKYILDNFIINQH